MLAQPPLHFGVAGAGSNHALEFVRIDPRLLKKHLVQRTGILVLTIPTEQRRPAFIQRTSCSLKSTQFVTRVTRLGFPQICRQLLQFTSIRLHTSKLAHRQTSRKPRHSSLAPDVRRVTPRLALRVSRISPLDTVIADANILSMSAAHLRPLRTSA